MLVRRHSHVSVLFTSVLVSFVFLVFTPRWSVANECLVGIEVPNPDLFCTSKFRCSNTKFPTMQYTASLEDDWACRCCTVPADDDSTPECDLAELATSHCSRYALGAWSAYYGLCAECDYGYVLLDSPYPSSACILSCASILHCTDCGGGGICRQCERGYVPSADSLSCEACPANCQDCTSATSCSVCSTGYTLFDGRCVECTIDNCALCHAKDLCNACDTSFTLVGNACAQCDAEHCSTCTDPSICTACASGYTPLPDGTACVLCLVDNCAQCTEENVCGTCDSGYSLSVTHTCDICLVDNCDVCTPDGDGLVCQVCDDGFNHPVNGQCREPDSWTYFFCMCFGVGVAVIVVILLILWCANGMRCLPKTSMVMPLLSGESRMPFVGDARWKDDNSSLESTPFTFSEKTVPMSSPTSRDIEMRAFSGTSRHRAEDNSPVKFVEAPEEAKPPCDLSTTPAQPVLQRHNEPEAKPSTMSQRRGRRVQFVLDDDITDRYVPSSTPILANAMWDVVVAPMPAGLRGPHANVQTERAVSGGYAEVQPFLSFSDSGTESAADTMSHVITNDAQVVPVENPLAIRPSSEAVRKPKSRRSGLAAADDDGGNAYDYGNLSIADDLYSDMAF